MALNRSLNEKVIGGVAGGIAAHLDIQPVVVRIIFVIAGLSGPGILIYLILWLLLPEASI